MTALEWDQQTTPGNDDLRSVYGFHDCIFAVGDEVILRNRGGQWEKVTPEDTQDYRCVWGPSSDNVFVLGDYGTLLRSSDGGDSWRSVDFDTVDCFNDIAQCPDGTLIIVGEDSRVMRSTDGGDTWEDIENEGHHDLFQVHAIDDNLIAVGYSASVLISRDAGKTWKSHSTDDWRDFRALWPLGPNEFVLVGESGALFTSSDGGASWKSKKSGTDYDLHDIVRDAKGTLYAVGDGGLLLRSEDRGETWIRESVGKYKGNYGDSADFYSMWGAPEGHFLAVGDNATVLESREKIGIMSPIPW